MHGFAVSQVHKVSSRAIGFSDFTVKSDKFACLLLVALDQEYKVLNFYEEKCSKNFQTFSYAPVIGA
jgi:hypothetical protein